MDVAEGVIVEGLLAALHKSDWLPCCLGFLHSPSFVFFGVVDWIPLLVDHIVLLCLGVRGLDARAGASPLPKAHRSRRGLGRGWMSSARSNSSGQRRAQRRARPLYLPACTPPPSVAAPVSLTLFGERRTRNDSNRGYSHIK